jgi:hypothetical protein
MITLCFNEIRMSNVLKVCISVANYFFNDFSAVLADKICNGGIVFCNDHYKQMSLLPLL